LPSAGDGAAASTEVRTISGPEAEPVDLLAVSRESVLKRLVPLLAAGAVGAVIVLLLARRRAQARRLSSRSGLTAGLAAGLAASLPFAHDVAGYLPSVGDLTGHLPDWRVADVPAALRRHRH
jgi:hypothetical protein